MNEPTVMAVGPMLAALKWISTDALQHGMRAFEHPPRKTWHASEGDAAGCFMWEAGMAQGTIVLSLADSPNVFWLSAAYESYNDWFKGECLRELAERGVAPEAAPQEEAPCLATT